MQFCSSRFSFLRLCFVVATFGFFVVIVPASATNQAFRRTGRPRSISSVRGEALGRPLSPDEHTSGTGSTATNSRPIFDDHGDSNISISNNGSEGEWEESRWHDDVSSQCEQSSSNHMLQHSFARDAGGIKQIRSDIVRGVIVVEYIRFSISVLPGNWRRYGRSLAYSVGKCFARVILRLTGYLIALELGRLLWPATREEEKQNKHLLTPSLSGTREFRSSLVRGLLVINAIRYFAVRYFLAVSDYNIGTCIKRTTISTLIALLSLEFGCHGRDNKSSYTLQHAMQSSKK